MEGFEWDPKKAAANLDEHKVDFADAAVSLSDPLALTTDDPDSVDEQRFITLAMDPQARLLVTVHAQAEENTRIISSRKASPGERKHYMRHKDA
jgi:uncharacterized protein